MRKLQVIQSSGNADVLIVQTAIRSSVTRPTVVNGEDTNLLILLLHHVNQGHIGTCNFMVLCLPENLSK